MGRDGVAPPCMQVLEFYKAWDRNGALSNFSPHTVELPAGPVSATGALSRGAVRAWPSVEHFYQAQKFAGAAPLHGKVLNFHCFQLPAGAALRSCALTPHC